MLKITGLSGNRFLFLNVQNFFNSLRVRSFVPIKLYKNSSPNHAAISKSKHTHITKYEYGIDEFLIK